MPQPMHPQASCDPVKIRDFVSLLLFGSDATTLCESWSSSGFSLCSAFVSNFQPEALYVSFSQTGFDFLSEIPLDLPSSCLLSILLKSEGPFTSEQPLATQIQLLSIPHPQSTDDETRSSYGLISRFVSMALAPYFDYVSHMDPDSASSSTSLAMARKKFSELTFSLQQLQQRIHVPDLMLSVSPMVAKVLDKTDSVEDPSVIGDTAFLNELTKTVNAWLRQVQSVTLIERNNTEVLSIQEEVLFWNSMELALESIKEQVSQPSVRRAIEILNAAKRFQVTLAFQNNIGIVEKLDETKAYNVLLKDLPINEIIYSKDNELDLTKMESGIMSLFNHLKKWKNLNTFPLVRMIELIELLLKEIVSSLTRILLNMNLMAMPFAAFEIEYSGKITLIFHIIDVNVKFMVNIIRELMRKRQEKFMIVKIDQHLLTALHERIEHLRDLRRRHQELLHLLSFIDDENNLTEEITLSFSKNIAAVDAFDFSKQGTSVLQANEQMYLEASLRVLNAISTHVNYKLLYCDVFSDFIAYFMKFHENGLLNSTLIVNFVNEKHKLRLLDIAYADIQSLFKTSYYTHKESIKIPKSVSLIDSGLSSLIWDMSIKNKLEFITRTLTSILGENWNKYSTGADIEQEITSFSQKLRINAIFEEWVTDVSNAIRTNMSATCILKVEETDVPGTDISSTPKVKVNFNQEMTTYITQAQDLMSLGFEIPMSLLVQLEKVCSAHPLALSLQEHIDILDVAVTEFLLHLNAGRKFGFMLESQKKRVFEMMPRLMYVEWSSLCQEITLFEKGEGATDQFSANEFQLTYVKSFQDEVYQLHCMCNLIHRTYEVLVQEHYTKLEECTFSEVSIQEALTVIQEEVYLIAKSTYDDIEHFVEVVNEDIMHIFSKKCSERLRCIANAISKEASDNFEEVQISTHFLTFENNSFLISPPLEKTKLYWISLVDNAFRILAQQKLISLSSKESRLVLQFDESLSKSIDQIMKIIDAKYSEAAKYLQEWRNVQQLISPDGESSHQDDESLQSWLVFINGVNKCHSLIHNSTTVRHFGNKMEISFSAIQTRVATYFDVFEKSVFEKFLVRVHNSTSLLLKKLNEAVKFLSSQFSINQDVSRSLKNVEVFFSLVDERKSWLEAVNHISTCQRLLQRRGVSVPPDWIYVEQLESTISNVKSLIKSCEEIIEQNMDVLRLSIQSESDRCLKIVNNITEEWQQKKPISAHLQPKESLSIIAIFQTRCNEVKNNISSLSRVSSYLNIDINFDSNLDFMLEEVKDLKNVWTSLLSLWNSLSDIKSQKWTNINARTLKSQLEELLSQCRATPVIVRQYSAFEEIQKSVKKHLNEFPLLSEMKNPAIKPRHWIQIFSLTGDSKHRDLESILVGDVLKINLQLHELMIKDIVNQANGERIIEEGLKAIEQEWESIVFETFNYQNKVRLVKNWNFLFEQCETNLGTLSSMKNSTHHGPFEIERAELEDKMNRLLGLFNLWIEVQSQWMYLDGVFDNCKEVQSSLPVEFTRFNNITFEFITFLKRINKFSTVIEVLSYREVEKTMQKISDTLVKTRKGLSEFLEKQREMFPRLCFVGNDDLLELIGNGTNVARLGRQLKQMFSGIASVEYDSNSSSITALISPQDERLELEHPISLIKNKDLLLWLCELESEMRSSLSKKVLLAVDELKLIFADGAKEIVEPLRSFLVRPCQVSIVAFQVYFTLLVETSLANDQLSEARDFYANIIKVLVQITLESITLLQRHKLQSIIVEIIHHRDVVEELVNEECKLAAWNCKQRYYLNSQCNDPLESIIIKLGRSEFFYGFEYQGVPDRLAYTPLVEKCFLSMAQALAQKLGGSPFGPAGTGKTECIKALGINMGRMVLVFNCDETFDYLSMGRILLGISKVGCWGCFDEFNRLETNSLSALSSQICNIERGLKDFSETVEISGRMINVHPDTGIFITMNPGYVGRNELPENLRKQFREFSMHEPEKENIVDVILASHCFLHSALIAKLLTPFVTELASTVTKQPHYDFGLRAIKSILSRCGLTRRQKLETLTEGQEYDFEMKILLQCLKDSILPKLIKEDEQKFDSLLLKYFPNINPDGRDQAHFIEGLLRYAEENGIDANEMFVKKALQILQIQENHHGFMLVGKTCSGKTTLYKLVLNVLAGSSNGFEIFVIDSKVLSKEELYGVLDPITRDWSDGIFTKILRSAATNLRGEQSKRIWIVFDGDIDPEWAENLNSVLDDNKLLTLPNGERIELAPNLRILFEVDSLKYTTLATISRCGMVWFDRSIVPSTSLWDHHFFKFATGISSLDNSDDIVVLETRKLIMSQFVVLAKRLTSELPLQEIIREANKINHIMTFDEQRCLSSFFTYFTTHCSSVLKEKERDPSVQLGDLEIFVSKAFILSLVWAFAGDAKYEHRIQFSRYVGSFESFSSIDLPENILELKISVPDFEWVPWSTMVETVDLEPHHVLDANTIVPTVDTVIHESLIHGIINKHSALILCGPPGSGKTMTLLNALRRSPNLDVISLNFSKDTSPQTVLSALQQHCAYKRTNSGMKLMPKVSGKWVVVFCDEINLPVVDKYGTQRVNAFIRQMIEHSGFWRPKDLSWVTIENIQFVGACNDPNDPGRHKLSDRFMRHVTLVMVDNPGPTSLKQIYQTFNKASLKCTPKLRQFSDAITNAMLDVYSRNKKQFTVEKRSHYIYSPRELTRWCRGVLEALLSVNYSELSGLIRLWYHEGLRLFYDRLVDEDERKWCKETFWKVGTECFPHVPLDVPLKDPVLFSTWLTSDYESVDELELRNFVRERLRVFNEEEQSVDLILYDDLLDHVLRIDRVLRQHQGHAILVGPSTSGKTTLTRFVAWMNGLKIIQLRVRSGFSILDFEDTLRSILFSCAKGEKLCFLIDESSILETSFVERMNSLLANSEVPGLFEGDNLQNLLKVCRVESTAQGLLLDSDEELYSWFTKQISENLHVIFTISNLSGGTKPQVNSSPALFNRCVLSWMGDWSDNSLFEVASSIVGGVALDQSSYIIPESFTPSTLHQISSFREVIVDCLVFIHKTSLKANKATYPNKFIKFVQTFVSLFEKNQGELEENQRHTNIGLDKLRETVLEVNQMKKVLFEKKEILMLKDEDAKKMLNKMIVGQNEAERKREFSVATQVELEKQEVEINARRAKVMQDLELAEPAVLEAQRGVQNIKKQHLTEMRSMSNPPSAVKLAMESVCILLGYQVSTWRDVQLIIRKDDFITSIVSYDNETCLTSEMRKYMEEVYLSRPDFNYETVNRASKACGPLLQWVIAQLRYSTILEEIGPLREEVVALETSATKSKAQLIAIAEMIEELEQSIQGYKNDYSELIREAERVKLEIENIEKKVDRSLKLIENLTKERQRWQASINAFEAGRERIIGNSILGAAFCCFCGNLDQSHRHLVANQWKEKLRRSAVFFDESLAITSMLASAVNIAKWASAGLPNDQLFIDNFSIMGWSTFPYIVDPTENLVTILKEVTVPKKMIVTSFLDDTFIKVLEDAMRFGGTILIQNAEAYDPILDSVLRQDYIHNGGRKSLQIANRLVDILDDFSLILYTTDNRVKIAPFVSSRCTVLNYSITAGNLENQVLNISLKHSRPDLYSKRIELISLQSDYQIRLLGLRQLLLLILNDISGTILESDEVIESLERIESESSDIDTRIGESEVVMSEVNKIRNEHTELANHSKSIYHILMALALWNSFYNFSLNTYIEIFMKVLNNSNDLGQLENFVSSLYHEVFIMVAPTLQRLDKIVFAVALAISFHSIETNPQMAVMLKAILEEFYCSDEKKRGAVDFLRLCLALTVPENIADHWSEIFELNMENETFKTLSGFIGHLVGAPGCESTLIEVYESFASRILLVGFDSDKCYGIKEWVHLNGRPILISSTENVDVTFKVQQVAKLLEKDTRVVSMGSKEGVDVVLKELEEGSSKGTWLIVQNIQLASYWLPKLQRILEAMSSHESFRLFLTCNLKAEDIPSGLIAMSQVLTYENQQSFKATLLETFENIVSMNDAGTFKHVAFLLSWYHSIIRERLKYVPESFEKLYDMNETDVAAAGFFVQKLYSNTPRAHENPDQISWKEISYVVGNIIYGGKISNELDAQYCTELARHVFSSDVFHQDFNLVRNGEVKVKMPDCLSINAYKEWIENLPEVVPLSWLELSEDVNTTLKQKEAKVVASKVVQIYE